MHVTVQDHKLWVADTPASEGAGTGKPPVLLLHGFPDSHALWDKQVPVLAAAGHRVIAPDLLGFGKSDQPQELEPYKTDNLVSQLVGLLEQLSIPQDQQLIVVGHDWGAVLAWSFAAAFRERVAKLVVLAVGFPGNYFQSSPRQREASWYMMFFQLPEAEELLQQDDWALMRSVLHSDQFCLQHLFEGYKEALSAPGALTAGLNWYRANFSAAWIASCKAVKLDPPFNFPVLGIVADGDAYCTEDQMRASEGAAVAPDCWRFEVVSGCGHCIPLQDPDRLNSLLSEFLRK